jgi:hypothetical protein
MVHDDTPDTLPHQHTTQATQYTRSRSRLCILHAVHRRLFRLDGSRKSHMREAHMRKSHIRRMPEGRHHTYRDPSTNPVTKIRSCPSLKSTAAPVFTARAQVWNGAGARRGSWRGWAVCVSQ